VTVTGWSVLGSFEFSCSLDSFMGARFPGEQAQATIASRGQGVEEGGAVGGQNTLLKG
jgi:hypothetical protein